MGTEVFHTLKGLLSKQGLSTAVGDEGGFAPNLESSDAAGALLVREAGGLVAGIDSSENFLESGNVVAGSPKCFKAVLQTVKPLLR